MKYFPLTTNTISNIDKKLAIKVLNSGNITRGKYNRLVEKYFSSKFKTPLITVS